MKSRRLGSYALFFYLGTAHAVHAENAAPKISIDSLATWTYDNDGLAADKSSQTATSRFALDVLQVFGRFDVSPDVTANITVGNLADEPEQSFLQEANVHLALFKNFKICTGRFRLLGGGWSDHKSIAATRRGISLPMEQIRPLPIFGDGVHLEAPLFGMLRLQLTNDQTTPEKPTSKNPQQTMEERTAGVGEWNKTNKQPAVILSWTIEDSFIKPLLEATSYDLNKGLLLAAGLQLTLTRLTLEIDYLFDRWRPRLEAQLDEKPVISYRQVVLRAQLDTNRYLRLWTELANYGRSDEKKITGIDNEISTNAGPGTLDDNAMLASFGAGWRMPIHASEEPHDFMPFLSFQGTRGKYATSDGQTEFRQKYEARAGTLFHF